MIWEKPVVGGFVFSSAGIGVRDILNLMVPSTQEGNTALHIAAKLGNMEVMKPLVHQGADPRATNVVREHGSCGCLTLANYTCPVRILVSGCHAR